MSLKNSNDTSWDRTSDLPICSQHLNHCATAVPHIYIMHNHSSVIILRQRQEIPWISASIPQYRCYTSPASYSVHVATNVDGASQLIISANEKDILLVDIGQREYSRRQKVQSSSVIIPTIRGTPVYIHSVV